MDVTLLTPLAGFVALLVVVPLAVMMFTERRVAEVRAALRLPEPRASRPLVAIVLVVLAALLGLGAAQPAVKTTKKRFVRSDAEVYLVFDTSRSMLARGSPNGRDRFERARVAAHRIRDGLPEVPVGVASLTDRALPHLLPTVNEKAFDATIDRALGVDRPPPLQRDNRVASTFDALRALPQRNFFAPQTRERLVVFLTDGESRLYSPRRIRAAFRAQSAGLMVVHFWRPGERIFRPNGAPEAAYTADPASAQNVRALARGVGGRAFDEARLDDALAAIRSYIGTGKARPLGKDNTRTSLAPYLFLGAFAPLGFLLWRRNF